MWLFGFLMSAGRYVWNKVHGTVSPIPVVIPRNITLTNIFYCSIVGRKVKCIHRRRKIIVNLIVYCLQWP